MGELAIGLYDLTAHYKALWDDYAQLEAIVEIAKGIDWEVIADDLTYDENILECTKTKIVKLWKALGGE